MPVETHLISVSVLLPLFNGVAFLKEQVQSILGQTGIDVRLFILDDASSDGSLALARQLAAGDERISVLEHEENKGLIPTLDRLLSLVETPYFALSDQDDVWDSKKLHTSVQFLESHRHELVYSDVRIIDETGREQVASYLTSRHISPVEGRNPVPFVFRNPAVGHTIVGRREVAEAARPIPGELVFHEAWLAAVACSRGTVGFVRGRPLGSYRVHASNVVGPTNTGFLGKARIVLRNRAKLAQRERIRAAGLSALAHVDGTLVDAVNLYSTSGVSRLRRLPTFARFQLMRNRQSGMRSIGVETLAFALNAFRR